MGLKKYAHKRKLNESPEPPPKIQKSKGKLKFVVQEHAARRLHYDLRLEVNGVLKSWAVPKGPSLHPDDKRLAIMVEDHPYEYQYFEGVIPSGYGAGTVAIWDHGTYSVNHLSAKKSEKLIEEGLVKGEIHFFLEGEKLRGEFILVRITKEKNEWLLIKKGDEYALSQETEGLKEDFIKELTKKASKKRLPSPIKPMLAKLVKEPFDHSDWIFEIKWDGFRAIAEIKKKKIKLYSRTAKSFNEQFPFIIDALKKIKHDVILDGEIVFLDKNGLPNFQSLQNIQTQEQRQVVYYVFDLLFFEGFDLTALPLEERKKLLTFVLKPNSPVKYCDHVQEQGEKFFKVCTGNGLEGIIAKQKNSIYLPGIRTGQWLKMKSHLRQDAIICGFTRPKGGRKHFGALILGIFKNNKLHFIGHVGGGFTEKSLKKISNLLKPFIQETSPFSQHVPTNTHVTWVKPHFLCEVQFSEWTSDGIMRQPIFIGLREDKKINEAVEEKAERPKKEKIQLSNLDKLFWPKENITKGDLIEYYKLIAPYLLPYLKDRPQSLKRFPNGIEGEHFFQKNLQEHPSWIKTVAIEYEEKTIHYLLIQNIESLIFAVNLGCIELHPFFSRIQTLDYPDFLTFDLDPENTSFEQVVEVAHVVHAILEELSIPNFCKTSGARGLHICVPLKARYTYEQAKNFAKIIASLAYQKIPDLASLERSPRNRQKKVYIDVLQNNPGQTLASVYSVRAKPKAPVSTPLLWKELHKSLNPEDFTMFNIPSRLKKMGDLFKPVLGRGISISKILPKIEKFYSRLNFN